MSKTLFYNAKVYVERDTFAEAVYQEDGWIKAVGSNADVCALAADDAEKIDCEGRVLVPGFNDSHMHMCFTGENMLVPTKPLAFFNALAEATGDARWAEAADGCFAWLEAHPLADWNWDGQFEDVQPRPPYANPTKHHAVDAMLDV